MNILLLESHYRTRSWFLALESLGKIHVMSLLPEEKKIFLSRGVNNKSILNLYNPNLNLYDYLLAKDYLKEWEREIETSINEIVLMDRTLRLRDEEYITKYVYYLVLTIKEFIIANKINIVFSEPTWTHEIIVVKICELLKIKVFALVKDKILPNRFFMFEGYKHEKFFIRERPLNGIELAEKTIQFISNVNQKPQYFGKFNKRNKFSFSKLKVLYDILKLSFLNNNNINIQPSVIKSIKRKFIAISRAKYLSHFGPFIKQEDIKSEYILITLHVQPEMTIDVLGGKFSNQLDFIRQVVRTTPMEYLIVVKEHPHSFGDRSSNFYKELLSMPRVMLLAPFEDGRKAIKKSKLVLTNTGTSSLEASVMGIPGITATNMYFSDLMLIPSFNPSIDRVDEALLRVDSWNDTFSRAKTKAILSDILENSFEGNCLDFKTDPSVLDKSNINNLRNAFSEVIESNKKKSYENFV